MRIFKTPSFQKDLAGSGLVDSDLIAAVREIEAGLVDAHLGAELLKKRIARANGGKSGGYRSIVAYRQADRLFFLHLFAKNEKSNVTKKDLAVLKALAKAYMSMSAGQLDRALAAQVLLEVE